MPGVPKIRGKINLVLNGLVRAGVITGFRTNFDVRQGSDEPLVTVTVPDGRSLEDVRVRVLDALTTVAVGIDIRAEHV